MRVGIAIQKYLVQLKNYFKRLMFKEHWCWKILTFLVGRTMEDCSGFCMANIWSDIFERTVVIVDDGLYLLEYVYKHFNCIPKLSKHLQFKPPSLWSWHSPTKNNKSTLFHQFVIFKTVHKLKAAILSGFC